MGEGGRWGGGACVMGGMAGTGEREGGREWFGAGDDSGSEGLVF